MVSELRVDGFLCVTTGGAAERAGCTVGKIDLRVGDFTRGVFRLEANKQVKVHHSLFLSQYQHEVCILLYSFDYLHIKTSYQKKPKRCF